MSESQPVESDLQVDEGIRASRVPGPEETRPTRTLTQADLQPGDVLLARGIGDLGDAICKLDGGDYSHAAFWDGAFVIEAVQDGVHAIALEGLLSHRRYTDAYRFRKDGHALGDAGWPARPIVDRVHGFVGGEYASAELLLMGVVIATTRWVKSPLAKLALTVLGGPTAELLQRWLDEHVGRQHKRSLVCTQVVTSGYYEAAPAHTYAIDVDIRGRLELALAGPALGAAAAPIAGGDAAVDAEYAALSESCDRLIAAALPDLRTGDVVLGASAASGPAIAPAGATPYLQAGSPFAPIATPRELQRSPTLSLVGRLAQP